ncbi:AraC family transcriptional regulator [Pseudooceanicola sp. CBS1P-1]|uniref:Helix-turn-helix domain-containing protein n=2 Tax=Paracoccaceae TaxID=31989 RepID=A0A6L7G4C3_9RHOB|nr:AraC family transcriptional regulator [Pseudooceanicola endophyticus]MXN18699.1 helix-turn-helix domain-containing protein [Pseudooceanicola albus]
MEARTRALRTLAPLKFRPLAGAVADLWQVAGEAGAGGFYRSPDPRLVVFTGPRPPQMAFRTAAQAPDRLGVRAMFVPAGVPLWARLLKAETFGHVDFHLDIRSLRRRLAVSGDSHLPQGAVFAGNGADLETLAGLAAAEVARPARGDMVLDGLLQALLGAVLHPETDAGEAVPQAAGLRPHQARRLEHYVQTHLEDPLGVAELAGLVGLSESWFSRAFKQSFGLTPKRWIAQRRVARAQQLILEEGLSLAEVALATGFADQAHLSRAFSQAVGMPPSRWRHIHAGSTGAGHDQPPPFP